MPSTNSPSNYEDTRVTPPRKTGVAEVSSDGNGRHSEPNRPRAATLRELLTNEGSAPPSTSQFDLVINNLGRLR